MAWNNALPGIEVRRPPADPGHLRQVGPAAAPRTVGKSCKYGEIERLDVLRSLIWDLGVNLGAVEIILNTRKKMESLQSKMRESVW